MCECWVFALVFAFDFTGCEMAHSRASNRLVSGTAGGSLLGRAPMFWFAFHSRHRIWSTGFRFAVWLAFCWVAQVFSCSIGTAQQTPTVQHALSVSGIVDRARKLIQDGNPQGALALLQQADLRGSNSSDIHTLKGVIFAMLAKPIESSAEFDQAIALRPNFAPVYLSAGLAAANFDNLSRASEMLSKALRLDPALPGLRYNYAL